MSACLIDAQEIVVASADLAVTRDPAQSTGIEGIERHKIPGGVGAALSGQVKEAIGPIVLALDAGEFGLRTAIGTANAGPAIASAIKPTTSAIRGGSMDASVFRLSLLAVAPTSEFKSRASAAG